MPIANPSRPSHLWGGIGGEGENSPLERAGAGGEGYSALARTCSGVFSTRFSQ